jgi:hypothetical protein
MNTTSRTKVEAELLAAEQAHEDDPERAELLRRARAFKSSWIELAEALTTVRKTSRWRDWGYASLEEYASKELHLRAETIAKLTGSYAFLQKRAPQVLERDGVAAPIPSYQAIEFLRKAEEQPAAPRDAIEEIRKKVIDEGVPVMQVARQFKDVVFPIDDAAKKKQDAAGLKNVARRLRELLADTRAVPKTLAREVSDSLDRLLEAVDERAEKAA